MAKLTRQVLVVGSASGFVPVFEQLEVRGYHFEYVANIEAARTYLLRQAADVLLLRLPEGADVSAGFAWLQATKGKWPVVVISREEDVQLYLTAMERGAFDYFTCQTPMTEVRRVLDNAIRWRQLQAA